MELEQFDILEEKLNNAISLIDKLHSENQRLTDELLDLQQKNQSQELSIQQLNEENQNLKQKQDNASFGHEKDEKIRFKVEQMLKKLDALQKND